MSLPGDRLDELEAATMRAARSRAEQPSTAATPEQVQLITEIRAALTGVLIGGGWSALADRLDELARECRQLEQVTIDGDVENSE